MKISKLYDDIVFFLFYWCTLQEVILSVFYKITANRLLTNILFYSKDFFMVVLFLYALTKKNRKKILIPVIFYILLMMFSFFLSVMGVYQNGSANIMKLFQSLRNFLVFPCFVLIGANINYKVTFINKFGRYFLPFVTVCALVGIVEYCMDFIVGTKTFWTSTIGYTNFLVDIKHQSDTMLYGLPGNFYGSYGRGFFSTKRLVGPWGNPLTSAYSMALPTIYYFIKFVDCVGKTRLKKNNFKDLLSFVILLIAVVLSHTRLIWVLLAFSCSYYLLVYRRRKIAVFAVAATLLAGFIVLTDWKKIVSFMYDGSTISHVFNVTYSISNMKYTLFGNGISYMGIYGASGTESTYLTILANLGVIGLVLFMVTYFTCCRFALKNFKKGETFGLVVFLASILFSISGLGSEQLFAYTTIADFYILFGMYSHEKHLYRLDRF